MTMTIIVILIVTVLVICLLQGITPWPQHAHADCVMSPASCHCSLRTNEHCFLATLRQNDDDNDNDEYNDDDHDIYNDNDYDGDNNKDKVTIAITRSQ